MKNILVTGHKGFIGKKLCLSLENMGLEIEGIDSEIFENDKWFEKFESILNELNPSIVFHVGACSNTLETNVQFVFERNYEFTKMLSNWCFCNNRKLIYSSSAANYGVSGKFPSNLYGWSKYVAEELVIKNKGIALRYFNVYGPGEEHKGEMASFLYQAYVKRTRNEPVLIFPKKPERDFIYIEDVVSANLFAWKNFEKIDSGVYEVSTARATSFEKILEIADIKYEYTSEELIPKGYQFYTCGDQNKWLPGWIPKFSLEDAIKEYLWTLKNR